MKKFILLKILVIFSLIFLCLNDAKRKFFGLICDKECSDTCMNFFSNKSDFLKNCMKKCLCSNSNYNKNIHKKSIKFAHHYIISILLCLMILLLIGVYLYYLLNKKNNYYMILRNDDKSSTLLQI